MDLVITLINHGLPILITLFALVVGVAMVIGTPYCRYVAFVSRADTARGTEELAKYLAQKAAGRKINVENTWRSFLPAARGLHQAHINKRSQISH